MPDGTVLTALVPTFNEEANLRACLESLRWVDQIVVVDSYSTDATVAIAREFTDRVIQHEYVNSATQKNWALENVPLAGEWVLIVDADERVTPELAAEIREVLSAATDDYDGYFINRREFCFGRQVRHAGMSPNWNLRLLRRGRVRYEDREVDADVTVRGGQVGRLKHPMDHLRFPTISSYLKMLDRYSTWDALEAAKARHDDSAVSVDSPVKRSVKEAFKRCFALLPAKGLWLFGFLYFWQLGFLDGRAGLTLCVLSAFRQFLGDAKLREIRRDPARAEAMRREATRGGGQ
jgi:glycosyltransferase involved in cell wall biosynthesis